MASLMLSSVAFSSALDLKTLLQNKNTNQQDFNVLYTHVFPAPSLDISKLNSSLNNPISAHTSTSITSQMRQSQVEEDSKNNVVGQVLAQVTSYFKKNIKNALLPDIEAAPVAGITLPAIDRPTVKDARSNLFRLKVEVEKNFVRPKLTIKNALNTGIQTQVSFHTRDLQLEAVVSSPLSNDLFLTVTNNDLFKDSNEKNVVFCLQYRF